jgi:hypothetical protein
MRTSQGSASSAHCPLPFQVTRSIETSTPYGPGLLRGTISGPSIAFITSETGRSFSMSVVIARMYLWTWRNNFL